MNEHGWIFIEPRKRMIVMATPRFILYIKLLLYTIIIATIIKNTCFTLYTFVALFAAGIFDCLRDAVCNGHQQTHH